MRAPHFKRERGPHTGTEVFNYSIQFLNSAERQLAELRASIAEAGNVLQTQIYLP